MPQRIIALLGLTISIFAVDVESAKATLTNGTSREWTFKRIRTTLGSGCSEGEVWRFSSDDFVVMRVCENGSVVQRKMRYTLQATGSDTLLTLGGLEKDGVLALYFREDEGSTQMLLRKPAKDKSQATVDRTFSSPKPKRN